MEHQRSTFSNKLGFVLAAAGSAVGLGNIWRFPYLAAKYGGGIFLLIYLILVISFGFTVMITEVAIGRKTSLSPIGAFAKINPKSKFIGVLASLIAFLILPYYSVIGGWVIKYLITFLEGTVGMAAASGDTFFTGFISSPLQPILWQALFVIATLAVILGGVKGGVERVSKILMPLLVVLCLGTSIFIMFQPGALDGVKYYIVPDFSKFTVNTLLAAMGQMFYSMSLAMGIMITYGSYLRKQDDLEKSVGQIEWFDTGIAFLAGLMIIPAVFTFAGNDQELLAETLTTGPSLMFISMPKVFESMGPIIGTGVGITFFVLVLFAALTSAISLMEAVVSTICDCFKISRKVAAIGAAILAILIGMPSSLGFGPWESFTIIGMSILDFFDFFTNSLLMPIVALCTCVFIGWVTGTKIISDEVRISSAFKREKLYIVMVKYIAPVLIFAILIWSVGGALSKLIPAFEFFVL